MKPKPEPIAERKRIYFSGGVADLVPAAVLTKHLVSGVGLGREDNSVPLVTIEQTTIKLSALQTTVVTVKLVFEVTMRKLEPMLTVTA